MNKNQIDQIVYQFSLAIDDMIELSKNIVYNKEYVIPDDLDININCILKLKDKPYAPKVVKDYFIDFDKQRNMTSEELAYRNDYSMKLTSAVCNYGKRNNPAEKSMFIWLLDFLR
jgi:hypothetical protein